jgi:transmembrane sensor
MNDQTHVQNMEGRRLAEASAWRVRLTEMDAESTEAFEAWLADDPGNQDAWARVEAPWNRFGENPAAPELIAARRMALGDAARFGRRKARSSYLPKIAAAAVLLLVGGGIWAASAWMGASQDYRTALGERRVLTLSDGSRVSLDSASELRVRYSKGARELSLLSGQARFDVKHDAARPFSVSARGRKVVALGTAFNVDIPGSEMFVTLIEGRVMVVDDQRKIELRPGEQLDVSARATKVAHVNIERATAWQNGQLVFDNEPLSSVVARVSRYASEPVVLKDKKAESLRISGVFNTGDVIGFVDTVTHYLPLKASAGGNGEIDLRSKG